MLSVRQVPTVNWAFRLTCLLETTVYNQLGFYFVFEIAAYSELGCPFGDLVTKSWAILVTAVYNELDCLSETSIHDELCCLLET